MLNRLITLSYLMMVKTLNQIHMLFCESKVATKDHTKATTPTQSQNRNG